MQDDRVQRLFSADQPNGHRHVYLTDRAVVHLVTTLPGVPQFGPTPVRSG